MMADFDDVRLEFLWPMFAQNSFPTPIVDVTPQEDRCFAIANP